MIDTGMESSGSADDSFRKIWQILEKSAEESAERHARWEKESAERHAEWEKEYAERHARWEKESTERRAEREKESAEREKESAERRAEWEKESAEREKESAERRAEWEKEYAQLKAETEQARKETNKIIGDLGNRFGELAEHLVAPNIKEKFQALGLDFEYMSKDHEIMKDGRSLAEIDLMLENNDLIVVVEVKAKPAEKDVDEHCRRMEIVRQKTDTLHDSRKLQGAIAGAIMTDTVRRYAHKAGFYVIEQTGDTVKISIPEGFIPKEW